MTTDGSSLAQRVVGTLVTDYGMLLFHRTAGDDIEVQVMGFTTAEGDAVLNLLTHHFEDLVADLQCADDPGYDAWLAQTAQEAHRWRHQRLHPQEREMARRRRQQARGPRHGEGRGPK